MFNTLRGFVAVLAPDRADVLKKKNSISSSLSSINVYIISLVFRLFSSSYFFWMIFRMSIFWGNVLSHSVVVKILMDQLISS